MNPLKILIITDNIENYFNFFKTKLKNCHYTFFGVSYIIYSPLIEVHIRNNFKESMRGCSFDRIIIDKDISVEEQRQLTLSLYHTRRLEYTNNVFNIFDIL